MAIPDTTSPQWPSSGPHYHGSWVWIFYPRDFRELDVVSRMSCSYLASSFHPRLVWNLLWKPLLSSAVQLHAFSHMSVPPAIMELLRLSSHPMSLLSMYSQIYPPTSRVNIMKLGSRHAQWDYVWRSFMWMFINCNVGANVADQPTRSTHIAEVSVPTSFPCKTIYYTYICSL